MKDRHSYLLVYTKNEGCTDHPINAAFLKYSIQWISLPNYLYLEAPYSVVTTKIFTLVLCSFPALYASHFSASIRRPIHISNTASLNLDPYLAASAAIQFRLRPEKNLHYLSVRRSVPPSFKFPAIKLSSASEYTSTFLNSSLKITCPTHFLNDWSVPPSLEFACDKNI